MIWGIMIDMIGIARLLTAVRYAEESDTRGDAICSGAGKQMN